MTPERIIVRLDLRASVDLSQRPSIDIIPPYALAPEVLAGRDPEEGFGPASDTYAFGMLLYKVLVGVTPWGDDADVVTVERLVEAGDRPPLPPDPAFDGELHDIIEACWHTVPARRPVMGVVRRRLEAWTLQRQGAGDNRLSEDVVESNVRYVVAALENLMVPGE